MRGTVEERFWAKVNKTSSCWEWTAATRLGYGKINVGGRTTDAHRLSYEWAHGPVPAGLYVLHKCDNRLCVNPDHLFVGTQDDNMKDMLAKGRQHIWGSRPEMRSPDKACEYCGQMFHPQVHFRRFCSVSCSNLGVPRGVSQRG